MDGKYCVNPNAVYAKRLRIEGTLQFCLEIRVNFGTSSNRIFNLMFYAELHVLGTWLEERMWNADWAHLEEGLSTIVQGLPGPQ